jgi:hypothetical protein
MPAELKTVKTDEPPVKADPESHSNPADERLTDERLLHALLATYDLVVDRQNHLLLAETDLRRYLRMYYERKSRGDQPARAL